MDFRLPVTFLAGGYGSGKSTLLEAIAGQAGFHAGGGNRNHFGRYEHHATESGMARHLSAEWRNKAYEGCFLRAESFYNFATYFDDSGSHRLGGTLHTRSHGEACRRCSTTSLSRAYSCLTSPKRPCRRRGN